VKVERKNMTLLERSYLWEIGKGLATTIKHAATPSDIVTRQYPEEKTPLPEGYRGIPALIKDEDDRIKCVACQLCEFVCPPEAIKIVPAEYADSNVEKYPARFDLNMLRCIYCGLCEEACPEEAIFMSDVATFVVESREQAILPKEQLLEIGGRRAMKIRKWANK
jgi:NADH-quinone oxidoreductase subunit I